MAIGASIVTLMTDQLGQALQRLASLSGRRIDRLQLQQMLHLAEARSSLTEQINSLCHELGWANVRSLHRLDEATLPTLAYTDKQGWQVLVARTPEGYWKPDAVGSLHPLQDHRTEAAQDAKYWHVTDQSATPAGHGAWQMIRSTFLKHKRTLVEGALASVLINLVALASSFFSMQVYDRVIPTQGYATLQVLCLGVFLAIAFELTLKYTRSRVLEYAVVHLDSALSRDVFERLLNVRMDQLPQSVGSLTGQLRAYEGIRALLTASTAYLLVDIPFALVFIALMAVLGSVYAGLIPLLFLVVSLLTGLALRRGINTAAMEGARAANQKTGLLVEAVEGAETIKSGNGGWRFLSRWIRLSHKAIGYDLRIRHLSETGGFLTASFQQLSYAGLIAVGAWQVMEGNVSMGGLIACSILSGRALSPAGMIPGLMVQYAHAKAALDGLEKVYALESDNAQKSRLFLPERLGGSYVLKSVRYAYQNNSLGVNRNALTIDSLQIQAGEKVGVIGTIGSGKSTLLRLLSGLYQPREGRILLDDLDLSFIARQSLSEQVGYLQQEHRLFQGTLRDNVLIGMPDPGDDALMEAARISGLVHLIRDQSLGWELPISEGGKGLSGGQRQLVALTRLLISQPQIWLLDEPTASMDPDAEKRCVDLLQRQIKKEHTLVLVTHKPMLLSMVDRIIVMAQQQVLMDGPRDYVLQQLVEKGRPV
jgi:ATP-binding cassette, subfamily C, bacterial LapB